MSTQKNQNPIISAFAPVINQPEIVLTPVYEENIVETLIVDTYEQDEEGNIKAIRKQIIPPNGVHNRQEYIESFSDEVGIQNILEKIGIGAIAEDKYSILKTNKPGEVTDLTGLADVNNYGDIVALAEKAKVTWENLDPALKKNMSYAEFCEKFGNKDLTDYVEKVVQDMQPKKEGEDK